MTTACRPLYDYVLAERRRVDVEVFGATAVLDVVPEDGSQAAA